MPLVLRSLPLFVLGAIAFSPAARAETSETEESSATRTAPRAPVTPPYLVVGLAALGGLRQIYDLSAFGAGAELTLGGEGEMHGGYYHLRYLRGETKAGLALTELGALGSYEVRLSGIRAGAGAGLTWLSIQRATTGQDINSIGLTLLARLGYDFEERSGFYLLSQVEWQTRHTWGPTAYVGYRF